MRDQTRRLASSASSIASIDTGNARPDAAALWSVVALLAATWVAVMLYATSWREPSLGQAEAWGPVAVTVGVYAAHVVWCAEPTRGAVHSVYQALCVARACPSYERLQGAVTILAIVNEAFLAYNMRPVHTAEFRGYEMFGSHTGRETHDASPAFQRYLIIEMAVLTCLSLDSATGVFVSPTVRAFVRSPYSVVDFLVLLSMWASVCFDAIDGSNWRYSPYLCTAVLRVLRLRRLTRTLREDLRAPPVPGMPALTRTWAAVTVEAANIIMYLSATSFWLVWLEIACPLVQDGATCESQLWRPHNALYFMVTLLSTVGYGDIFPVTDLGRLFTMAFVLFAAAAVPMRVNTVLQLLEEDRAMERSEQRPRGKSLQVGFAAKDLEAELDACAVLPVAEGERAAGDAPREDLGEPAVDAEALRAAAQRLHELRVARERLQREPTDDELVAWLAGRLRLRHSKAKLRLAADSLGGVPAEVTAGQDVVTAQQMAEFVARSLVGGTQ